jgi:hypothetical protein
MRDLTGEKFGRLTVAWPTGIRGSIILWLSFCECGGRAISAGADLVRGRAKSCGCLSRDLARKRFTTHKMCKTAEYRAYFNAKDRCRNPRRPEWKNYGGRGIQFRFKSFVSFLEAVGPKPEGTVSIDRRDNDGHYEHGNLRWATRSEQNLNRRRRSHCNRGHELTEANAYGVGRRCRICQRKSTKSVIQRGNGEENDRRPDGQAARQHRGG